MNNKARNISVTVTFILFIAFFVTACIFKFFNPTSRSEAERRPLAQFPENITWEGITDKTIINEFEDYSVDQFPFREFFRYIKAHFQFDILNLNENNSLTVKDGYIAKIEQDFTESNVNYSIGKLQNYYEKFVKNNGGKHYISIIPDKNYFLGKDYGYPSPNYSALTEKVTEALNEMEYINIFDVLEIDDYYRTDTHWSQDKIIGVAEILAESMGFSDRLSSQYTANIFENFKGVYYGQSALNPKPDKLVYLTNSTLDSCKVFDYEKNTEGKIYDIDKLNGNDAYDVFLSGTKPLLRIDNPISDSGKTLVIFRDSYGSSLAPLLVEAYETIYLVDIRYIDDGMLSLYKKMKLIDFENADVLFIYSALILNSNSFK